MNEMLNAIFSAASVGALTVLTLAANEKVKELWAIDTKLEKDLYNLGRKIFKTLPSVDDWTDSNITTTSGQIKLDPTVLYLAQATVQCLKTDREGFNPSRSVMAVLFRYLLFPVSLFGFLVLCLCLILSPVLDLESLEVLIFLFLLSVIVVPSMFLCWTIGMRFDRYNKRIDRMQDNYRQQIQAQVERMNNDYETIS